MRSEYSLPVETDSNSGLRFLMTMKELSKPRKVKRHSTTLLVSVLIISLFAMSGQLIRDDKKVKINSNKIGNRLIIHGYKKDIQKPTEEVISDL